MGDLGNWLPEPPDFGSFDFGPRGGGFQGGAVTGSNGVLAFIASGSLPDGWHAGPPEVDEEEWTAMARVYYEVPPWVV